ncbi:MAG: DUF6632 domain-containing protein [Bryobacteraceae bacterium]
MRFRCFIVIRKNDEIVVHSEFLGNRNVKPASELYRYVDHVLLSRVRSTQELRRAGGTTAPEQIDGGIMAVQSVANSEHLGHLWGDVLALFAVAAALALLTPRGAAAKPA